MAGNITDLSLPTGAGSYALFLELAEARRILIGRLGERDLPPGAYAYLGSALGPGGLRARIGRHVRGGKRYWHIDGLMPHTKPIAIAYRLQEARPGPRLECSWARALGALPGAAVPAPGFGASDCHAGCPAHLVLLPEIDISMIQDACVAGILDH